VFQALEAFRGQIESLHLSVAFASGGKLAVTVAPKVTEEAAKKNPALAQTFGFTASAEDLDAGFVQALADVSVVRKDLVDQVAAQAAALGAAKKAVTKSPAPALPAPTQSTVVVTAPAQLAAPVTITGAEGLFGDEEE